MFGGYSVVGFRGPANSIWVKDAGAFVFRLMSGSVIDNPPIKCAAKADDVSSSSRDSYVCMLYIIDLLTSQAHHLLDCAAFATFFGNGGDIDFGTVLNEPSNGRQILNGSSYGVPAEGMIYRGIGALIASCVNIRMFVDDAPTAGLRILNFDRLIFPCLFQDCMRWLALATATPSHTSRCYRCTTTRAYN